MANATIEADKIGHSIQKATKDTILWTGAVSGIISLLSLIWQLWSYRKGDKERRKEKEKEEGRRKRAEDEDGERRRKADQEDEERRRMADGVEEAMRWRRQKEDEERWRAMAVRENEMRKATRDELTSLRRDVNTAMIERVALDTHYKAIIMNQEIKIEDLEDQNARLQRQLNAFPGWAPGALGQRRLR